MFLLHVGFLLVDHQIWIRGRLFWNVNFALCKELWWRSCMSRAPKFILYWSLIRICCEDRIFLRKQSTILKLLRKLIAWHIVGPILLHVPVCTQMSAPHVSKITSHTTEISLLRGQPAAHSISFSAKTCNKCCSGIWALEDIIIKDAELSSCIQ